MIANKAVHAKAKQFNEAEERFVSLFFFIYWLQKYKTRLLK